MWCCSEKIYAVSKESKIVCSVKVSWLEFVSLPIADQLQLNFYKLPCLEQKITKLDWKSTMYNVVKYPWIFIFVLLCLIFSRFLILFMCIINIGYWQILFITLEQLGKSYSATSTFKCWRSTAAVLVNLVNLVFFTNSFYQTCYFFITLPWSTNWIDSFDCFYCVGYTIGFCQNFCRVFNRNFFKRIEIFGAIGRASWLVMPVL